MNTDTRPPSYPLRMPPELRARLESAAKSQGRSLQQEILYRIEQSFARQAITEDEHEAVKMVAEKALKLAEDDLNKLIQASIRSEAEKLGLKITSISDISIKDSQ